MEKVRLMRVFNPFQGGLVWVPRKLHEMGFKTKNVRGEHYWIMRSIWLAEKYNQAERQHGPR